MGSKCKAAAFIPPEWDSAFELMTAGYSEASKVEYSRRLRGIFGRAGTSEVEACNRAAEDIGSTDTIRTWEKFRRLIAPNFEKPKTQFDEILAELRPRPRPPSGSPKSRRIVPAQEIPRQWVPAFSLMCEGLSQSTRERYSSDLRHILAASGTEELRVCDLYVNGEGSPSLKRTWGRFIRFQRPQSGGMVNGASDGIPPVIAKIEAKIEYDLLQDKEVMRRKE